jgi:hypothetical protein
MRVDGDVLTFDDAVRREMVPGGSATELSVRDRPIATDQCRRSTASMACRSDQPG